ncbi:MAG: fumarate hydratase [Desulfobacteraceae bacterium]|nr:MAG: fumarate hydratase [Desulfobacteraceae bacterium]
MTDFIYESMFPLGEDDTVYRRLTADHVSVGTFEGRDIVKVAGEGLTLLAEQAFKEVSHYYRSGHLMQLANILDDPESSANDRFVALEMLKNAVIAAEGELPMCQDTGTAVIIGKKGQQIWTGGNDEAALSKGVYLAYTRNHLRYSQNAPLSMYAEKNTACNLPAQIELYAVDGGAYSFLMLAKGGGSANKTYLFQETKAVLTRQNLVPYLVAKMKSLGTAACPPYHLAVVVGGLSAEMTLKTVKLASARYLDQLPTQGGPGGHAFRDLELEAELLARSRQLGLGAQFGGKYFCHDVRVIRLPRHGASCPIGIGVSCSADRNIKAKITSQGIFLEQLETDPSRYLPQPDVKDTAAVRIDLNQPMTQIRTALSQHPVATRLLLNGTLIVARDIAHARLKERLDQGRGLPQYFKDHIIYYAGPAKTPPGYAAGAFGPTTAGRMDPYVPIFQAQGGSLVMLAKGNRSPLVAEACQKFGGFYLGSIGGPAARLAKDCITHMELLEFPELGMEAIYKITVKDFPAFILVDDKGNDFFAGLL